jgi:hypothetical protein
MPDDDQVTFRVSAVNGWLQIHHEAVPGQYARVEVSEPVSWTYRERGWIEEPIRRAAEREYLDDVVPELTPEERAERARQLEWDRQYAAMVNRRVAQDTELAQARREAYLREVAGDAELDAWSDVHEDNIDDRIERGKTTPEKPVNWSWL